jgi:FAD dependent oxidoreductase
MRGPAGAGAGVQSRCRTRDPPDPRRGVLEAPRRRCDQTSDGIWLPSFDAMRQHRTPVLVVGGGLGGVAAALAAADRGVDVVLAAERDWLGGQLTSQAVPPDEHPWIERFGCTARYRRLRDGIRAYYRAHYPLTTAARTRRFLNPGASRVSALAHEPPVARAVIDAMLAAHRSSRRLQVLFRHVAVEALVDADRVEAVTLRDGGSGNDLVVQAEHVLDATETGELLPLCGAEYVTGFESRAQTGEPHAPRAAQPLNMQPVTACFALDHLDGQDHTMERPAGYAAWKAQRRPGWPEGQLSFLAPDPRTGRPVERTLHPNPPGDPADVGPDLTDPELDRDLWLFRRIAARGNFLEGRYRSDITLANWPQIDYSGGPIFEVSDDEAARHRRAARELSLCLLYWLQTEAPRARGGTGWPGLRLRGDIVGATTDGLAPALYVRESRRIRGERTIVEQDISFELRGAHGAEGYPDTVGIGAYRIDLHPSTGGDPYIDVACCPFQIPLGALLPLRVDNLVAAAKNVATTHITNGAYRLHPVEWNIGEAAGHLAAFCVDRRTVPRAVRADPAGLWDFQRELLHAGVELHWPDVSAY